MDPSLVVKDGYNAIARRYLWARSRGSAETPLLAEFVRLVPQDAYVLDIGCGAGVPVTQFLAQSHRTTGVDFSLSQLRLAISLVPGARFACQDMTALAFPPGIFDAVCSFYAIIHVPRTLHEGLLKEFRRVLKSGGLALLCLGAEDNPEDRSTYLGAPMYWSHFGTETYLAMLAQTGFRLLASSMVPDPIDGVGHHFFALVAEDGP